MNELINDPVRLRQGKFRERYRSIDVLLIDDVQFIAGKERTQEEFFHTFNALYDGQKQIVLTSDCPPRDIPEMEERLHSRFEWGLIADIEPPDLETKVAILRRKAELQRIDLPDDVALFLASNSKHNIRELEGSLIRVMAMASLQACRSQSAGQGAMRNVSQVSESESVTIPMIQKVVADYYKVGIDDLKARSNVRQVLFPRQIAMYLCKRLTRKSYPEIGRQFGGKHHTTVMHSVEKIDQLIGTDRETEMVVKHFLTALEFEHYPFDPALCEISSKSCGYSFGDSISVLRHARLIPQVGLRKALVTLAFTSTATTSSTILKHKVVLILTRNAYASARTWYKFTLNNLRSR
jgi:chromosomal replication initiator protein